MAVSHESGFDPTQERFLALNVESIHEARFFSAWQTDDGIEIIASHIAAISEEDEIALAEIVLVYIRVLWLYAGEGGIAMSVTEATSGLMHTMTEEELLEM